MPVTARLSKLFYDRLGEAIANELVDWFNQVDATYRSDLKEINELNFARFEAKLEQRIAELRSELRESIAELRTELRESIAELRTELRESIAGVRADQATLEARFTAKVEAAMRDQTRFFFLAWAILLASNIALWFR